MGSNWTQPDFESLLYTIDLELSGHCNAHCVFCPRDKMSREKSFLSLEKFEILLREISIIRPDGPKAILFCGFGEPLLNENLCEFADRINEVLSDTLVVVVSNASALNKETCDAILTGNIFTFSCSMYSINKEKYEANMLGLNFDSVIRWMTYLAERHTDTGLQISMTYVKAIQTDREIEEYYKYWNRLGVQVGELKQHNRGGFLNCSGSLKNRERKRCSVFNTRLFIAANGDVLACCQDLDGQSKLGTIGIDSLHSILVKKMIMIKNEKLFPMCAKCNDASALE